MTLPAIIGVLLGAVTLIGLFAGRDRRQWPREQHRSFFSTTDRSKL